MQTCDGDLRKRVCPVDFDIRVALVIFQADVIFWLVPLDEVHLEDQCLELGSDYDPLDIDDMGDQLGDFAAVGRRFMEIGSHPVAQVDRLADIDDLAGFILHQVAPGFCRDSFDYRGYVFIGDHAGLILAYTDSIPLTETLHSDPGAGLTDFGLPPTSSIGIMTPP